jgi:hypothetical protein
MAEKDYYSSKKNNSRRRKYVASYTSKPTSIAGEKDEIRIISGHRLGNSLESFIASLWDLLNCYYSNKHEVHKNTYDTTF